jgi:hypothetical protein
MPLHRAAGGSDAIPSRLGKVNDTAKLTTQLATAVVRNFSNSLPRLGATAECLSKSAVFMALTIFSI